MEEGDLILQHQQQDFKMWQLFSFEHHPSLPSRGQGHAASLDFSGYKSCIPSTLLCIITLSSLLSLQYAFSCWLICMPTTLSLPTTPLCKVCRLPTTPGNMGPQWQEANLPMTYRDSWRLGIGHISYTHQSPKPPLSLTRCKSGRVFSLGLFLLDCPPPKTLCRRLFQRRRLGSVNSLDPLLAIASLQRKQSRVTLMKTEIPPHPQPESAPMLGLTTRLLPFTSKHGYLSIPAGLAPFRWQPADCNAEHWQITLARLHKGWSALSAGERAEACESTWGTGQSLCWRTWGEYTLQPALSLFMTRRVHWA